MTVEELKRMLDCFPDECEVIFTPDDYCGSGYPEWERCHIKRERDDDHQELGLVTVLLKGERDL